MVEAKERKIGWDKLARLPLETTRPNARVFNLGIQSLLQDTPHYLQEAERNPFKVQEDLLRRAAELLLIGPRIAVEHGGLGLDALETYKGAATMAYESPGAALSIFAVGHSLVATPIEVAANLPSTSEKRRQELLNILEGLRTGDSRGFFALTDKRHGSDSGRAAELKLTDGPDGGLVLNGPKDFITNPEGADYGVVIADYNDKRVVLLLDMNRKQHDGAFQIKGYHEKISFKGPVLTSIEFNNFILNQDDILGSWKDVARPTLIEGRNIVASLGLGIMARALDITMEWAKHRRQFDKQLFEIPYLKQRLTMGVEQFAVCNALLRKAAEAADANDVHASVYAAIAKVVITESAIEMAKFAQQILGARGVVRKFYPTNSEDDYFTEERRLIDQNIIDPLLAANTLAIVEGASTVQTDVLIYPYVTEEQMFELARLLPSPDFVWGPYSQNRPTLEKRLEFIQQFIPPDGRLYKEEEDEVRYAIELYGALARLDEA